MGVESDKMKQPPRAAEERKNQPKLHSMGLVDLSTKFNESTSHEMCEFTPRELVLRPREAIEFVNHRWLAIRDARFAGGEEETGPFTALRA